MDFISLTTEEQSRWRAKVAGVESDYLMQLGGLVYPASAALKAAYENKFRKPVVLDPRPVLPY